MKKLNVKIVILGHLRNTLDLQKLKAHKSRFFHISEVERVTTLPDSKKDDEYMDIAYSREETQSMMVNLNGADIIIGILNYRLTDNFYIHLTGINKACISIADVDRILLSNKITIENFLLKNIYELVTFANVLDKFIYEEIYRLVHKDTRGCLFDINGDKVDVLYNTEQPIICDSCKAFINSKSVPNNFIKNLETELKRIKKSKICSIEIFIAKYPLFSVLATFLMGILVNIASNLIWEWLK